MEELNESNQTGGSFGTFMAEVEGHVQNLIRNNVRMQKMLGKGLKRSIMLLIGMIDLSKRF